MPTDQPTPCDVAEAKVSDVRGGVLVETTVFRLYRSSQEWVPKECNGDIGLCIFDDVPAARAALAAAQERAGVYARPEGRTCECVGLLLSDDVRKSQLVAGWPDNGIWHPVNYDEWDRRYVWAYWELCRLCNRGVPKAPAAPGGEAMKEKYESLIPAIRSAARALGYAVGVHGSMSRDLDLIAVPWEDDAAPPAELAEAIRIAVLDACGACYLAGRETGDKYCEDGKPGWKPHGRLCWTYYLGGEPYIDLSVMPRGESIPAAELEKLRRDSRAMERLRSLLALHQRFHGKVGCPGDTCYVCCAEEEADALLAAEGGRET